MCKTCGLQPPFFYKNKQVWTTGPSPNPGAARDAPRTSREPGPHFRVRLYTGQYNKERALPVPVFAKSTRELSGHPEENLGFV